MLDRTGSSAPSAGRQAVSSSDIFLHWHGELLLLMPPRLGASLQHMAEFPQPILRPAAGDFLNAIGCTINLAV
ncbi:hypothetical protein WJX82_000490 [Trebouxia sp. C0006]